MIIFGVYLLPITIFMLWYTIGLFGTFLNYVGSHLGQWGRYYDSLSWRKEVKPPVDGVSNIRIFGSLIFGLLGPIMLVFGFMWFIGGLVTYAENVPYNENPESWWLRKK